MSEYLELEAMKLSSETAAEPANVTKLDSTSMWITCTPTAINFD